MNATTRILIVEENRKVLNLHMRALDTPEYEVTAVADAFRAVEYLRLDSHIDLIIAEFYMPTMDGFALLKWCRANRIHVPMIFTTASKVTTSKLSAALEECCVDLLLKPISEAKLKDTVTRALRAENHKSAVNQPSFAAQIAALWLKQPM